MENPWVWIVGIVAAACVLALALWLNRRLKFTKDHDGISLELDGSAGEDPKPRSRVSVGEGLKVGGRGKAGDVTGVEGDAGNADVDVLRDAEIRGSVGDITGVSNKGKSKND